MNGFTLIRLAANFDAAIPRHRQKLFPQAAGNRAFPKYQAGTNPNDAKDSLRITSNGVSFASGNDNDTLVWNSRPTRQYRVQQRTNLVSATWMDAGVLLLPDSGTNTSRTLQFAGPTAKRFFRIQAIKPLAP